MLDTTNQLNSDYSKNFLTHQIELLVTEVPEERRESLAEEIKVRANLFGARDRNALKKVLRRLQQREA